jgi:hypothetical protein
VISCLRAPDSEVALSLSGYGPALRHTKLNRRYALRLAIGNERTTEEDVRRAWDVIRLT